MSSPEESVKKDKLGRPHHEPELYLTSSETETETEKRTNVVMC
jgi:hypothetical protein